MKAQCEILGLHAKEALLLVARKTVYVHNDGSAERTFQFQTGSRWREHRTLMNGDDIALRERRSLKMAGSDWMW